MVEVQPFEVHLCAAAIDKVAIKYRARYCADRGCGVQDLGVGPRGGEPAGRILQVKSIVRNRVRRVPSKWL